MQYYFFKWSGLGMYGACQTNSTLSVSICACDPMHASGYGPSGPDAQRPGYDVIVSARGGLMGITGNAGGPPCKVGVAVTDLATGLHAYSSIMAALWARDGTHGSIGTGLGQRVDCSLLETQVCRTDYWLGKTRILKHTQFLCQF